MFSQEHGYSLITMLVKFTKCVVVDLAMTTSPTFMIIPFFTDLFSSYFLLDNLSGFLLFIFSFYS